MTLLVTGGAGFIGSNFIFYWMKHYPEDRVICVDKLTYAGNIAALQPMMDRPNFRFCHLDICDRDGIERLFEDERPDNSGEFAAESHDGSGPIEESADFFGTTNIVGTSVLMDACRRYGTAGFTRFLQMKYMVICHWIGRNFFLRRRHR